MLHFSLASVLSSPSQPVSPRCYLSIPLPLPHCPFALLHLLLNPHSLATSLIRPLFPKSSKISLFQIWSDRSQLLFLGQHDSIQHGPFSFPLEACSFGLHGTILSRFKCSEGYWTSHTWHNPIKFMILPPNLLVFQGLSSPNGISIYHFAHARSLSHPWICFPPCSVYLLYHLILSAFLLISNVPMMIYHLLLPGPLQKCPNFFFFPCFHRYPLHSISHTIARMFLLT